MGSIQDGIPEMYRISNTPPSIPHDTPSKPLQSIDTYSRLAQERAIRSLRAREHRSEGLTILTCGTVVASGIIIAGWFTAPANAPGLLRFQALLMIAGYFGFGEIIGLWLWRASRTWRKAE